MERYSMFMDRKNNNVKIFKLPKTMYRFHESPIKIQIAFFTEIEQL